MIAGLARSGKCSHEMIENVSLTKFSRKVVRNACANDSNKQELELPNRNLQSPI